MDLHTRLVVVRAHVVVWRAKRRWRAQLRRELGSYATQAERDDLLATFDRYPDDVTREYRQLVVRGTRSQPPTWPAMGRRV